MTPPTIELLSPAADSKSWARILPAGFARYASHGKWEVAVHLLLIQQYLMAMLRGVFDNLIISMPPRHGKSMFVSQYFLAWYILTHPNHEVILTSYEAGLASMFGGRVRDIVAEFGPELFDITVRPDKRAGGDWLLRGHDRMGIPYVGGMRSAGVGSGITGRGANLIVIDDPVKDAKQANSENYRNTVWQWYLATLFSRREPGAKQICIMTRWHEDDLAGRLLERSGEMDGISWTELALPALADNESDVLNRDIGEALWPERWSADALHEVRGTMSSYWWSSLYQQRPAPAEGNIFKRRFWRFWKPADMENLPPVRLPNVEGELPCIVLPSMEFRAQSWDLTFKDTEGGSRVVGQLWGRRGSDAFLLDEDRAKRDFPSTLKGIREMTARYPDVETKWIEDAANAAATISTLKAEIPGLIPVQVDGSKEDRAHAVSSYLEGGNVYLPHPAVAPWVMDFIEEVSAFPNTKFNDRVDCMSQALRRLLAGDGRPSMLWGSAGRKSA